MLFNLLCTLPKKTDKLMSLLSKVPMFEHECVDYTVKHYFYRVEFQARGAPHLHCMFWLEGESGETPPSMYNYEDGEYVVDDTSKDISKFASSIMSGSSNDVHCKKHENLNNSCDDCKKLKKLVEHYQTHSHRPTCEKKNRIIRIKPDEGHGCNDGKKNDDELIIKTCRFNFPKNPIDKTEFILSFPKNHDKAALKQAKEDYAKIRKFLLRLTHLKDFRSSEEWKNFSSMSFYEFLKTVGMFDSSADMSNEKEQQKARDRYLTALRCEVKSSGMVMLKRDPCDVFTNNYNQDLIQIHQANMDLQFITDEYAVAEYVSDYCTKLENGQTALLRNINDDAVATGECTKETIKKLANALDKGRECSIQEAIYRLLGLSMTRFSSIVKFINTNHPDRREGLLKADL